MWLLRNGANQLFLKNFPTHRGVSNYITASPFARVAGAEIHISIMWSSTKDMHPFESARSLQINGEGAVLAPRAPNGRSTAYLCKHTPEHTIPQCTHTPLAKHTPHHSVLL